MLFHRHEYLIENHTRVRHVCLLNTVSKSVLGNIQFVFAAKDLSHHGANQKSFKRITCYNVCREVKDQILSTLSDRG